jgi:hypothetical protein
MHYAREAMVYAAGKNGEGSNSPLATAHCGTVRKSSVSRSASMTRYRDDVECLLEVRRVRQGTKRN